MEEQVTYIPTGYLITGIASVFGLLVAAIKWISNQFTKSMTHQVAACERRLQAAEDRETRLRTEAAEERRQSRADYLAAQELMLTQHASVTGRLSQAVDDLTAALEKK